MAYNLYPAVDENYEFPPEIRNRLSLAVELRNMIMPMTSEVRNNLTGDELWDGRVIVNTTTGKINRYDGGTASWIIIPDMDDISAALAGMTPIGSIVAYASSVAPSGWHLCDGSAHGSSGLETVLTAGGHPNPSLTPDLRDKFVLGDGGSLPASGGAATVTLTANQSGVPTHFHPGTTGAQSADHTHSVNPPSTTSGNNSVTHTHSLSLTGGTHGHNSAYGNNWQGSTQDQNPAGTDYGPIGFDPTRLGEAFGTGSHSHSGTSGNNSVSHTHTVDIAAFNSGGVSVGHTHAFTTDNNTTQDAANAHENLPPYYALTYIIKKI